MDWEPIGTGRLLPLGDYQTVIGVDLPIPSKPMLVKGALVAQLGGQFRYVTKTQAVTTGPRSGSLPQAGATTTAWRGARPFDGRPGASRLFGGRRRAVWPRC
jgi:hypothetical protein